MNSTVTETSLTPVTPAMPLVTESRDRDAIRLVLDRSLDLSKSHYSSGDQLLGGAYSDLAMAANRVLMAIERVRPSSKPAVAPSGNGHEEPDLPREVEPDPAQIQASRSSDEKLFAMRERMSRHLNVEHECKCGRWIRGNAIKVHVKLGNKKKGERGTHKETGRNRPWKADRAK